MHKLNVLIVDDNRTNLALMDMLIRRLPNCTTQLFHESAALVDTLETLEFDIAVVDYQMPVVDGVELTRRIRLHKRFEDKPIVMVTVDHDLELKMRALEAGVVEFLHKPIEPIEFKTRIRNLARLCDVQRALSTQAEWLRSEVEKATAKLRWREEEIVGRLARAAGYKDHETALHTARMARYAGILARELGLSAEECRDIQLAAPMHDIGKVGIRDDVLMKRSLLTQEERNHMNQHTMIGASILADSNCDIIRLAADIARSHHERWDGTGYPAGLKGEEIPLAGRIAAVADVFDALTSARPYKPAWTVEAAYQYLREQKGRHFDPVCVNAFEAAREEVSHIMALMADVASAA